MSIYGIGATQYPKAGYEPRRTQKPMPSKNSPNQMNNTVQTTQMASGTFELHISNETDGESIGAICGSDHSMTVYKPKDFNPANPVYKVKVWDQDGNITERMVDISKVDPKNSDYIDMFAYSSHLSASGEYPSALSDFTSGASNHHGPDSRSYDDLFKNTDWISALRDAMQAQYDAHNIEGYWQYKRFLDFLEK